MKEQEILEIHNIIHNHKTNFDKAEALVDAGYRNVNEMERISWNEIAKAWGTNFDELIKRYPEYPPDIYNLRHMAIAQAQLNVDKGGS